MDEILRQQEQRQMSRQPSLISEMQRVVNDVEAPPQVNFGAAIESDVAPSGQQSSRVNQTKRDSIDAPIDEEKLKKYADGPKFVGKKKKKKKK